MNFRLLFQRYLLPVLICTTIGITAILAQPNPFITVWKTDNHSRMTEKNQFIFPAFGEYDYYWESVIDSNINGEGTATDALLLTFPDPGTYRLTVYPTGSTPFHRIAFLDGENFYDPYKIIRIEQWGDIQWSSFYYALFRCRYITITATDIPDLSRVTNMALAFASNDSLAEIPNLNQWDMSNVTNMHYMFKSAGEFNSDISNWDVSNVTDMSGMFIHAKNFNQDICRWDVSNVTNMSNMFQDARRFNQEIGNWDVRQVKDMTNMFTRAEIFNGDIGAWQLNSLEKMKGMFHGARKFNQDISNWDVSKVRSMRDLFNKASSFNQDISSWDVSNVSYMDFMFAGATSFNQDIGNWDISNVFAVIEMFSGATAFNQDIGDWDVSLINHMDKMFYNATSFNQDLSKWRLHSINHMNFFFDNSGMDCMNYSNTLIGWAQDALTKKDIRLGAKNMFYSVDGKKARKYLKDKFNWTITGDFLSICSITSIKNDYLLSNIKTYPNPIKDFITLEGLSGVNTICLIDISGKVLIEYTSTSSSGTIDLNDIHPGLYFLRIASANGKVITKKVIKE